MTMPPSSTVTLPDLGFVSVALSGNLPAGVQAAISGAELPAFTYAVGFAVVPSVTSIMLLELGQQEKPSTVRQTWTFASSPTQGPEHQAFAENRSDSK